MGYLHGDLLGRSSRWLLLGIDEDRVRRLVGETGDGHGARDVTETDRRDVRLSAELLDVRVDVQRVLQEEEAGRSIALLAAVALVGVAQRQQRWKESSNGLHRREAEVTTAMRRRLLGLRSTETLRVVVVRTRTGQFGVVVDLRAQPIDLAERAGVAFARAVGEQLRGELRVRVDARGRSVGQLAFELHLALRGRGDTSAELHGRARAHGHHDPAGDEDHGQERQVEVDERRRRLEDLARPERRITFSRFDHITVLGNQKRPEDDHGRPQERHEPDDEDEVRRASTRAILKVTQRVDDRPVSVEAEQHEVEDARRAETRTETGQVMREGSSLSSPPLHLR